MIKYKTCQIPACVNTAANIIISNMYSSNIVNDNVLEFDVNELFARAAHIEAALLHAQGMVIAVDGDALFNLQVPITISHTSGGGIHILQQLDGIAVNSRIDGRLNGFVGRGGRHITFSVDDNRNKIIGHAQVAEVGNLQAGDLVIRRDAAGFDREVFIHLRRRCLALMYNIEGRGEAIGNRERRNIEGYVFLDLAACTYRIGIDNGGGQHIPLRVLGNRLEMHGIDVSSRIVHDDLELHLNRANHGGVVVLRQGSIHKALDGNIIHNLIIDARDLHRAVGGDGIRAGANGHHTDHILMIGCRGRGVDGKAGFVNDLNLQHLTGCRHSIAKIILQQSDGLVAGVAFRPGSRYCISKGDVVMSIFFNERLAIAHKNDRERILVFVIVLVFHAGITFCAGVVHIRGEVAAGDFTVASNNIIAIRINERMGTGRNCQHIRYYR